jgi:hypothetical protein
MKRLSILLLIFLALLAFGSCDLFSSMTNSTPDIDSVVAPSEMAYGSTTTITVNASDYDDDEITYKYSVSPNRGTLSTTTNTTGVFQYTAPAYDATLGTSVDITITVQDEHDNEISDDMREVINIDFYRMYDLAIDVSKNTFDTLGVDRAIIRLNTDDDTDLVINVADLPSDGSIRQFILEYRNPITSIGILSYDTAVSPTNYEYYNYYNALDDYGVWDDGTGYEPASFSAIGYIELGVLTDLSLNLDGFGFEYKDPQ